MRIGLAGLIHLNISNTQFPIIKHLCHCPRYESAEPILSKAPISNGDELWRNKRLTNTGKEYKTLITHGSCTVSTRQSVFMPKTGIPKAYQGAHFHKGLEVFE